MARLILIGGWIAIEPGEEEMLRGSAVKRVVAAGLVFAFGASGTLADDYKALSNTAASITGDISMDDFSISFANGDSLDFSELVSDHFKVGGRRVPASVYRVKHPDDPELENGNRLCGSGKVRYVATWTAGDGLTEVAVFTGTAEPESDEEMCASFTYSD